MIYILFFSLLSVAAPAFGSENLIKEVGIIVTFSRLTRSSVTTSSPNNLKQCLKLGIKGDLQEPFISIDEIRDIIINNKVCAGFSNPYCLLINNHNHHVVDKPIGKVWFCDQQTRSPIQDLHEIEVLEKENENIIRFVQKEGSGFFAIPVRLLTAQLSNRNNKEDKIVFHQACVVAGQETCNITMSVLREQLEKIPFADWLQDFEKNQLRIDASLKNFRGSQPTTVEPEQLGVVEPAIQSADKSDLKDDVKKDFEDSVEKEFKDTKKSSSFISRFKTPFLYLMGVGGFTMIIFTLYKNWK
jgi:hypothetical protein